MWTEEKGNSDHITSNFLKAVFHKFCQLWVRPCCISGAKSLGFVISGAIKKYKRINNSMLILCLQSASLSCEFGEFFQSVTLLKLRLHHRSFLVIFWGSFQLASLLKMRLHRKSFVVIFEEVFSLQLYQKRDSDTGVFL